MPSVPNVKFGIPCSVDNGSTTAGALQYFLSQVYVGETPKAKAASISTNGSNLFRIFFTRVFYRKSFVNCMKIHNIHEYGLLFEHFSRIFRKESDRS